MSEPSVSVVVIAYNMPREIPRTIWSLSTAMQVGVVRNDYEVILIDNGSTQKIDFDLFRITDVNLRVERLPPGVSSPCGAINRGLTLACGKLCGVMIDGARLASPGLVAGGGRSASITGR